MKKFLSNLIASIMALTTLYTFASEGEEIIKALGLYSNVKYQQGVTGAPKYQIGDFAQGGVVIWVTHDGEHGLVAAIEDLGGYYEWADSEAASTYTGAIDSDALLYPHLILLIKSIMLVGIIKTQSHQLGKI